MSNALRWTPEQFDAYRARRGKQTAVDIDSVHQRGKYGNKRENGFDSRREARRHAELVLLEKAEAISTLRRQVPFSIDINGEHVCTYKADFTYLERGRLVVEDAKGCKTPVYGLKKKLMKAVHGIEIKEV